MGDINFDQFLKENKVTVFLVLIGIIFAGFGALLYRKEADLTKGGIEVLESASESQGTEKIIVEIAGAIVSPGVYQFEEDTRVEDLLIAAGGISADADRVWMEKYLNRAAKITDGQKIYIPKIGDQETVLGEQNSETFQTISGGQGSGQENLININTASQKQLESLWGIGPVYAQNIIEQRPYSSVEELLTKGVIKENVYERNKDKLSVY